MPMHPHAKPNFRNLFWYPFKITLVTALRTFPFFGKWFGKRLGWGYHNTEHPEFLDDGSKSRDQPSCYYQRKGIKSVCSVLDNIRNEDVGSYFFMPSWIL